MSEYNKDELQYAIDKTGVKLSADDVATVLRYLSGPTHDQNDSVRLEGEDFNSDRVAMGGGVPTVTSENPTRRGMNLRDQAIAMLERDDQTGAVSSPKGTGNETNESGNVSAGKGK